MFIHNLKYTLKIIFRNKMLVFWTLAFPLILGTFFKMTFSDIENDEKLETINVAIIENEEFNNNEIIKKGFQELSNSNNEDRLFNIEYTTKEEAKSLLEDNQIVGYMELVDHTPKLTFITNGINQTIFNYVSLELVEMDDIVKNISKEQIKKELANENIVDYEKIYSEAINLINDSNSNINNISSNNLSYTMIEFYTLIAMTCLYGGIIGAVAINQTLANMSNQGKRIAMASSKKISIILSSVLASYMIQLIGIALLFSYTIFILNVDYGNKLLLDILLTVVGSLAGLSLGVMISSVFKAKENTKTGIIIAITMLGCFLSGMMGITMKYIIDKNIPVINKLNPASMITDGLYSLYYYETLNRYTINIISLLIFSIISLSISYISLRRQKYDSI